MKTFLVQHTPKSTVQDTWTVAFSLPYIAQSYARADAGVWYVKTWLTADQIKARLAILFDHQDELRVYELGRKEAKLNGRLNWMDGRLDEDEDAGLTNAPRLMWNVLHLAVQNFVGPAQTKSGSKAASAGNSRAA